MKKLSKIKTKKSRKNSTVPTLIPFETQRFNSMCDTRDLDNEALIIIGF